jgi:hypothetical protein
MLPAFSQKKDAASTFDKDDASFLLKVKEKERALGEKEKA